MRAPLLLEKIIFSLTELKVGIHETQSHFPWTKISRKQHASASTSAAAPEKAAYACAASSEASHSVEECVAEEDEDEHLSSKSTKHSSLTPTCRTHPALAVENFPTSPSSTASCTPGADITAETNLKRLLFTNCSSFLLVK